MAQPLAAFIGVAALSVALLGCGGDDDSTAPRPTPEASSTPTVPPMAGEIKTLGDLGVAGDVARAFEKSWRLGSFDKACSLTTNNFVAEAADRVSSASADCATVLGLMREDLGPRQRLVRLKYASVVPVAEDQATADVVFVGGAVPTKRYTLVWADDVWLIDGYAGSAS